MSVVISILVQRWTISHYTLVTSSNCPSLNKVVRLARRGQPSEPTPVKFLAQKLATTLDPSPHPHTPLSVPPSTCRRHCSRPHDAPLHSLLARTPFCMHMQRRTPLARHTHVVPFCECAQRSTDRALTRCPLLRACTALLHSPLMQRSSLDQQRMLPLICILRFFSTPNSNPRATLILGCFEPLRSCVSTEGT